MALDFGWKLLVVNSLVSRRPGFWRLDVLAVVETPFAVSIEFAMHCIKRTEVRSASLSETRPHWRCACTQKNYPPLKVGMARFGGPLAASASSARRWHRESELTIAQGLSFDQPKEPHIFSIASVGQSWWKSWPRISFVSSPEGSMDTRRVVDGMDGNSAYQESFKYF
ncbi:hypothetical protein VTK26DRAFT_8930 [Humicola hyalothermophila]